MLSVVVHTHNTDGYGICCCGKNNILWSMYFCILLIIRCVTGFLFKPLICLFSIDWPMRVWMVKIRCEEVDWKTLLWRRMFNLPKRCIVLFCGWDTKSCFSSSSQEKYFDESCLWSKYYRGLVTLVYSFQKRVPKWNFILVWIKIKNHTWTNTKSQSSLDAG